MKVICDKKGGAFTIEYEGEYFKGDSSGPQGNLNKKSKTFSNPEDAAEAVKQILIQKWT